MESIDFQSVIELWQNLSSARKIQMAGISLLGLMAAFVVVGTLSFRENKPLIQVQKAPRNKGSLLGASSTNVQPSAAAPTQVSEIMVDVEGAVKLPGVYALQKGSRVKDLIDKAGGFSSEADQRYISQHINLAHKLSDADKIYVPKPDDKPADNKPISTAASQSNYQLTEKTAEAKTAALVNLNTASQAQLESLPFIGPVYARRIISGRPYAKIEDITKVKGIGVKTFQKIKAMITVN